jgi:gliding motility-associated-like protein
MKAELSSSETGEWSLISGSGIIVDIHSPGTRVTGLSLGENLFLWKVVNGNCEATDTISIVVNDFFTPTVITPNEDGLNDKLNFTGLESFPGSTLIIYNRWGGLVYKSTDYNNDWDGKDFRKRDLEEDTYYYVLRISNGRILKGFIEIVR